MRSYWTLTGVVLLAFISRPFVAHSQSAASLPGCDAAPEVRKKIDEKLNDDLLDKMKFAERVVYERKILEDLMASYPREIQPFITDKKFINDNLNPENKALRERWLNVAKEHPDDPLALTIAGYALFGKETPEGIRLLELAKTKAQGTVFPWPSFFLASAYSTGKSSDENKMKQNLEAYFAACPGSTEREAYWLLSKDAQLQSKVAVTLRAQLATETNSNLLIIGYRTLWGLEFRTHPPAEQDALRAQVAQDLKRLEALNPHGNADWEEMLLAGYSQSGASEETVTAMENRLLHDFPHSRQAAEITYTRWEKIHPQPEDQTDKAAWDKWQKEYETALKGWIHDFTDFSYYQNDAWLNAIYDDDELLEKDGIAVLDSFIDAHHAYDVPTWASVNYLVAGEFLVNRKWQTERAFKLLAESREDIEKDIAAGSDDDNLNDEQFKERQDYMLRRIQAIDGLVLKAAFITGKTEEAFKLKAEVNGPVPAEKKRQSDYWLNRARLEVIEKHPQDALAYYQLAFLTRTEEPKARRGRIDDDLSDEAHALWKQQGGTETAYLLWSHPSSATEVAKEGRWEKPTKQLPNFELSDLSGKTWKLKELGGKTLLINLWATWCGPCQQELPHLEKLYEKLKDRTDIQILTIDLDEEVGKVAPFMKRKGYTFPVLPAYSMMSFVESTGIPQTWLVDSHGVWQSAQIGYGGGSDADFEKEMLERVEASKAAQ